MAESERLEFRVSRDLLDRIDEARGPVPRGTWIKAVLAREVGCATPGVEGKALVVANRGRAAARLERLSSKDRRSKESAAVEVLKDRVEAAAVELSRADAFRAAGQKRGKS